MTGTEPLLDAVLDLGTRSVRLRVAAGEIREVSDPELVPALTGADRRPLAGGPRHVVRLAGRRIERRGTAARVRMGLAVVSGAPVAEAVSVHDHLAAVVGDEQARGLLEGAPVLRGRGHLPAGVLSGGERLVLAWLRAVAVEPCVVILDQAGTGLASDALGWAGGVVEGWRREGRAVVLRPGRPEERSWMYAD